MWCQKPILRFEFRVLLEFQVLNFYFLTPQLGPIWWAVWNEVSHAYVENNFYIFEFQLSWFQVKFYFYIGMWHLILNCSSNGTQMWCQKPILSLSFAWVLNFEFLTPQMCPIWWAVRNKVSHAYVENIFLHFWVLSRILFLHRHVIPHFKLLIKWVTNVVSETQFEFLRFEFHLSFEFHLHFAWVSSFEFHFEFWVSSFTLSFKFYFEFWVSEFQVLSFQFQVSLWVLSFKFHFEFQILSFTSSF